MFSDTVRRRRTLDGLQRNRYGPGTTSGQRVLSRWENYHCEFNNSSYSLVAGLMMTIFGSGSMLGGPVAGWLTDRFGWHWSFWIQVGGCSDLYE